MTATAGCASVAGGTVVRMANVTPGIRLARVQVHGGRGAFDEIPLLNHPAKNAEIGLRRSRVGAARNHLFFDRLFMTIDRKLVR